MQEKKFDLFKAIMKCCLKYKEEVFMKDKKVVVRRINELCAGQGIHYYTLSYRSAVPSSTLMNIIHGGIQLLQPSRSCAMDLAYS